jgi:serine/threonine protein kinase
MCLRRRRGLLRSVAFLHGNGYCHNDIKGDNCSIAELGASYQLVLIDYGKMLPFLDAAGTIRASEHGPRGPQYQDVSQNPYKLADELNGGKGPNLVDGRKTDMFRIGCMIDDLVDVPKMSKNLKALRALLIDRDHTKRPLSADLLNDAFDATSLPNLTAAERAAYDWLHEADSLTDSQLIDELESRRPSEDLKADKYSETFVLSGIDVDTAIEAASDALRAGNALDIHDEHRNEERKAGKRKTHTVTCTEGKNSRHPCAKTVSAVNWRRPFET